MIGGAWKSAKNKAKREIRKRNSDEDLSQDGPKTARKAKPAILAIARCSLPDADAM
jgi:hypothetical protein